MTLAARLRPLLVSRSLSRLISRAFPWGVPSRAGLIWVRDPAVSAATAAELLFRLYERHELALIRRTMLPGCDVLELGAGIGVTGALTARRLRGEGRVVCLEANPALLPTLTRNLDRHRGTTSVSVVHGALAYGTQPLAFLDTGKHVTSRMGDALHGGTPVPTFTLGDILQLSQLRDFILVSDIEGTERDMISQDAGAFDRCKQIIIELHGSETDIRGMVQDIVALGFRVLGARKAIYSFARI